MLLLIALLACDNGAPAALPAPEPRPPAVDARAVTMGAATGFLARSSPEAATGRRVLLIAEGPLDDPARDEARRRAATGELVLLVAPNQPEAAALAYLEGLPGQGPVRRACLDPAGACVNQSP